MRWGYISREDWLVRSALILWIVTSFFIVFSLSRIDMIVNRDLYDFGLQFSPDWAFQYWETLRLTYVMLTIPAFLSVVLLALSFSKRKAIVCPSCRRVFGRPLDMLEWSSDTVNEKPRSVKICPYCSTILGDVEDSEIVVPKKSRAVLEV